MEIGLRRKRRSCKAWFVFMVSPGRSSLRNLLKVGDVNGLLAMSKINISRWVRMERRSEISAPGQCLKVYLYLKMYAKLLELKL